MMAAFEAVDLDDHRIAGLTFDTNLRLCTGGSTWPVLARFDSWLLVGGRAREVYLTRSSAAERFMGTVLIVPIDDQPKLLFELL